MIALLRAVAEAPTPPSLANLAETTSLNQSTAWRLLLTLEHHAFIDRDPDSGRYVLGHRSPAWRCAAATAGSYAACARC